MASLQKRGKNYRITVSRGYDIHGKKLIETTTYKPDPRLTERQQEKAASLFAREFELRVQNGYAWKCCSDNTIPKDTTTVQKPVLNPGTKMY